MMTDRVCQDGGLLVDANTRLASDSCEYYRWTVRALVGCSRLRCKSCNEWVRSEAGVALKNDADYDPAVLFASQSWAQLPFVRRSGSFRLYSCRCVAWEAGSNREIENAHDSPLDPNVPWACAGHATPSLPVTLGALTVGADSDCAQLVEKILSGVCPRPLELGTRGTEGPSLWLGWLYSYLAGLSLAEQLSSAIAGRIGDSDPLVVGRVLHFFARFPRASGIERIITQADVDRVAIGYPIAEANGVPTLWDVLVARLEQRTDTREAVDERTRELLQQALLKPLSSLSHEELGSTDVVEVERQRQIRLGVDVDAEAGKRNLADYAQTHRKARADVVADTFQRGTTAFNDADLRLFIANHIVELDAAARGRWRQYMDMLSDWYAKPELGHLIVIAGMSLVQARVVGVSEFREWIAGRRAYGWVDDAWVLPLTSVLDEQDEKPLPN